LSTKASFEVKKNEKSVDAKRHATAFSWNSEKARRRNKSDSEDSDDEEKSGDDDDDENEDDDDSNSDDSAKSAVDSQQESEEDCASTPSVKRSVTSKPNQYQVPSKSSASKNTMSQEGPGLSKAQAQLLVHKVFELENTISKLKREVSEKVNYYYLLFS
jgi:hypothetical protein